jgi:hypothetical protein
MSTDTLIRPAGDSGDWDDFLEFAAIVEDFDHDDLPEPDFDGHRHPKRPSRGADRQAAILRSLRGEA